MGKCELCEKETKLTYICPDCKKRFCREHRKPEDHNCTGPENIQTNTQTEREEKGSNNLGANEQYQEEQNESDLDSFTYDDEIVSMFKVVFSDVNVNPNDKSQKEDIENHEENAEQRIEKESEGLEHEFQPELSIILDQENEKTQDKNARTQDNVISLSTTNKLIFISIIIASITIGLLLGVNMNTQSQDSLTERYDALYGYYNDLLAEDQSLKIQIDEQTTIIEDLRTQIEKAEDAKTEIQNNWDTIFSNNIQYKYPTNAQLKQWLELDKTDNISLNADFSPVEQAISLSFKAKLKGWKLGVATIHANFSDTIHQYTYCYTEIEPDLYVYIDPQTDEILWTSFYDEITQNKVWNFDVYSNLIVTEVDIKLEY